MSFAWPTLADAKHVDVRIPDVLVPEPGSIYLCDQTIVPTGTHSSRDYPVPLWRVSYPDPDTVQETDFLTNDFLLPALTIAESYCLRWQLEFFFKWIKRHLCIKTFFSIPDTAVCPQLWIAVISYWVLAIARRRLRIEGSFHAILQILSVYAFEKAPLAQVLSGPGRSPGIGEMRSQLVLLNS